MIGEGFKRKGSDRKKIIIPDWESDEKPLKIEGEEKRKRRSR
jgi:hypothetical protein